MNLRHTLLTILAAAFTTVSAQKVTLGSCTTKDNGQYNGEMQSGKPQGKGRTVWTNGNTYEGSYEKGRRQGYGVYTFVDGERYDLKQYDGLYVGMGAKEITLTSADPADPAKFYINTCPAHKTCPTVKIDIDKANKRQLGAPGSISICRDASKSVSSRHW